MVSALRSLHLNQILDTLYRLLPEGPQFFDEDTVTDQPMRQIVAEMIREKALRSLGDEIPHGIAGDHRKNAGEAGWKSYRH